VELARDVVRALRATDHGADRLCRDPGDLDVALAEGIRSLADDEQDAPGRLRAWDGDRQLGPAVGQDGGPGAVPALAEEHRREGQPTGAAAAGLLERLAEDPIGPGEVDEPRPDDRIGVSLGSWRQPVAADLPDRDEVMSERPADRLRGRLQDVLLVVRRRDQPGERRGDAQVEAVALDIERIGTGGSELVTPGRGEAGDGGGVDGSPAAPRPCREDRRAVGRTGLRGGHEALQVPEPVAAVTARVDPVVAQATRVAPRPDRVRMHAQELRGLGDRERRVGWS
jgi:hypothetical protein